MHEMLSSDEWATELNKYTESEEYKGSSNQCILEKIEENALIELINNANSKQITEFRYALYNIFPRNYHKMNMEGDLEVISTLLKSIKKNEDGDKILNMNMQYLINQMNEIMKTYGY